MTIENFLNESDLTPYPLMDGEDYSSSSSGAPSVHVRQGIADAGFILGPKSGFDFLLYGVYLYSIRVAGDDVWFDFRCDAPEMAGERWLFHFPAGADFGCTDIVNVSNISAGLEDIGFGTGWLTAGDLAELRALGDGIYVPTAQRWVEPSRLQDATNAYVRKINIANAGRVCPDPCCSSSSSMTANEAIVQATDIVGAVKLKEGFNCTLRFNVGDNSIEIGAENNMGAGPICEDIIVDENGVESSLAANCPVTASCSGYITSINGICTNGALTIVGGPGVVTTPNQSLYRVTVKTDENRLCASSSLFALPPP